MLSDVLSTQNVSVNSTVQNQDRFISVVQSGLTGTQNLSQESGSIYLQTVSSILSINSQLHSQILDQVVDVTQAIVKKIELQNQELISSNIPNIIINSFDTVVQSTLFHSYSFNKSLDLINSTIITNTLPVRIMSTIQTLGLLQLEHRFPLEAPIIINSQVIAIIL